MERIPVFFLNIYVILFLIRISLLFLALYLEMIFVEL
jgi:hypothetical protein